LVRIGNEISPKDAFQVMLNSDDLNEIKQTMSYGICKIDFINQILSNELMLLVENWYQGLPVVEFKSTTQGFIEGNKNFILAFIVNYTPVFLLFIFYLFIDLLCQKFGLATEINLLILLKISLIVLFIYTTGIILGKLFARGLQRKINEFIDYSGFNISKGDKNYNDKVKNSNQKITNQIFLKIFLAIISGSVAVIVKFLIAGMFGEN
jgi:hypothetical protein